MMQRENIAAPGYLEREKQSNDKNDSHVYLLAMWHAFVLFLAVSCRHEQLEYRQHAFLTCRVHQHKDITTDTQHGFAD